MHPRRGAELAKKYWWVFALLILALAVSGALAMVGIIPKSVTDIVGGRYGNLPYGSYPSDPIANFSSSRGMILGSRRCLSIFVLTSTGTSGDA